MLRWEHEICRLPMGDRRTGVNPVCQRPFVSFCSTMRPARQPARVRRLANQNSSMRMRTCYLAYVLPHGGVRIYANEIWGACAKQNRA